MPGGQLVHAQHLLPCRALLAFLSVSLRIARAAINADARLVGQLLEGFFKFKPVDAAVKIKNIARGVAAKTVKKPLIFVDRKGRLGFLMEGAGRNPARPVAFQLHIAAHNVNNIKALFNCANCIPRLHGSHACVLTKIHNGHAVAATVFGRKGKMPHSRKTAQKVVHLTAQSASTPAVYHFHL